LRGQPHTRQPFELFLTRLMAQEFLKSYILLGWLTWRTTNSLLGEVTMII
jgi:hypothetical protein